MVGLLLEFNLGKQFKVGIIWGNYRGSQNAQLEGLESNTLMELKAMALHTSGIKSNWSQLVEVLVS
jgi:hypothetical protein